MTTTATVREFSSAGPCITLGIKVGETAKFIQYREWLGGDRYGDQVRRVAKSRDRIHTTPCKSCRDHDKTNYPNGYMG